MFIVYKQYVRIFWAYQNYSKSHPFSRTGIERLILKIYDKIVTEHNNDEFCLLKLFMSPN